MDVSLPPFRIASRGEPLVPETEVFIEHRSDLSGERSMSHVSTTELVSQLDEGERHYFEVFSEESMSVELARYPNPAPKTPHKEDELYYIVSGSGRIRVGDETYSVDEGDAVYVEQGLEHDFVDIEEEITALVVFAGSEESVLGRGA